MESINPVIGSWVAVTAGCPMSYRIDSRGDACIAMGNGPYDFEFALDAGALRQLIEVSSAALAEIESRRVTRS
jgi:hypothetical protein